MQPLACQSCGASLAVPDDLSAVSARCQFCGHQTPLPPDLLASRNQQRQLQYSAQIHATAQQQAAEMRTETVKTVSRTMMMVIFLVVGVPIFLVIGIVVFVFFLAKTVQSTSTPVAVNADPVVTPPPPPPDDPKSTGEERMTALMKSADAAGCKNVILPPSRGQGDKTLDTKFVLNGTCVRVFVTTGMPDNKITLSMKTPFGEPIKTPDPATELDFIYCPKKEGPHPTSIAPATDGYYTVAALECPASIASKKK